MNTAAPGLAAPPRVPGDLAMWFFILAELTVFGIFFAVYGVARQRDAALFAAGVLCALPAQAGRLCVAGHWWHDDASAYRQQVFWIDPQTEAHDAISAAGYLDSLSHHYPRFNTEALADLVTGFALEPHLNKPMYMLSAGSKRKVWLSAAFAAGTPLTLIDQPFAALDPPSSPISGHILVAEDNSINQMFVRELLKHCGCTCNIANNGDKIEVTPKFTLD